MAGLGKRAAPLVAGALVAAGLAVAPAYADDPAIHGPLESGDSLFPNQGNGGYDVLHYDVNIAWTPVVPISQSTIDATTTIEATTTLFPLESFGLDLEGLTVTSVTVNGITAGFSRLQGDPNGTEPPPKRKLVVTPSSPVSGAFTVVVDYEGIPTTHVDNDGSDGGWMPTPDGATFLGQPTGSMTGFPNNNSPNDKATYTFSLNVPDTFEVVANGEPEQVPPTSAGGRRTWVWNQDLPMAIELSLISIGQYNITNSNVNLSGGRSIPEWSFVDSTLSVPSVSTQLSTTLTALEGLFGPYPGNSTGVVVDNFSPGYALETQDRPFFPFSIGSNTFVHELAHQWYGDAVAPADWNGLWVNEGMATWAPTRLSGNTETTYFNAWNGGFNNWSVPPSGMTSTSQLFGSQSYTRGAMTYEALRAAIGDAAFFQLIRQWQTTYSGQTNHWDDLIDLAEEISGRDLTAFFQDWIYDPNKPAWPGKLSLVLDAAPAPGQVPSGSKLTYSLTATNTGRVPLTGAQVALDLSDVLDDATLGPLPTGVTQAGSILTWAVPVTPLASAASTSIDVTVTGGNGAILPVSASVITLGGTCTSCGTAHAVGVDPPLSPAPKPTVSGDPRVGTTLTAVPGAWPAGTSLSYQWTVDGSVVPTATQSSYVPLAGDVGKPVRVQVTGSKGGFTSVTKESDPTAAVSTGYLTSTPTPTVVGTSQAGATLSVTTGTWDPGASLAYQWLVAGAADAGATSTSYVIPASAVGQTVRVSVTGSRPGYMSVTRTSAPISVVVPASTPPPPPSTFPAECEVGVTGKARVGRKLTAHLSGCPAVTAVSSYQWFAGGKRIKGADKATYKIKRSKLGKRITVRVTVSAPAYVDAQRVSEPTKKVRR